MSSRNGETSLVLLSRGSEIIQYAKLAVFLGVSGAWGLAVCEQCECYVTVACVP